MNTITIKYNASVLTPAGHRGVEITASAEKISEKRARVLEILAIDGEEVKYGMSRTGAKRQQFNGLYVARNESGKTKNLSTCRIKE